MGQDLRPRAIFASPTLLSTFVLGFAVMSPLLAANPDARFLEVGDDCLDGMLRASPVWASQLGDHRFDGKLDDLSAPAREQHRALLHRCVESVDAIPAQSLERANQVDRAVLLNALRSDLFGLDELESWRWDPMLYTNVAGGALYSLLAREFAPLDERLGHVAERLDALPTFFAQERANLDPERVPKVHAETAARQNGGLVSLLDELVAPHVDALGGAAAERLGAALELARSAIEEQQKWLEETLVPMAHGDFRIGKELFERKLALTLDSSLDREEILTRARKAFDATRQEMYQVAAEVYRKRYPLAELPDEPSDALRQVVIRAALETAAQRKPPRDGIVAAATESLERATAFVREHGLVTVPETPVEIIIMPAYQRGVSVAYCDAPGALDRDEKTFYAVAPLPESWTDEQVDSFLREYNSYAIEELTIHEAMPGHFLQLAHSNQYPSKLRAVFSSGPFVEGWGMYAEKLMRDAGYLDGDPLMRLISLKWQLRAITNAILDQAIHVEGMSRDDAMRLMIEGAFQEEREAAGKWVRAQLSSTQLSTYFVGFEEHLDLRREVERREGAGFDLEAYHDRLLSFGSPPAQYVRALMLDEPIPQRP